MFTKVVSLTTGSFAETILEIPVWDLQETAAIKAQKRNKDLKWKVMRVIFYKNRQIRWIYNRKKSATRAIVNWQSCQWQFWTLLFAPKIAGYSLLKSKFSLITNYANFRKNKPINNSTINSNIPKTDFESTSSVRFARVWKFVAFVVKLLKANAVWK